jgi:hypothetical protein
MNRFVYIEGQKMTIRQARDQAQENYDRSMREVTQRRVSTALQRQTQDGLMDDYTSAMRQLDEIEGT